MDRREISSWKGGWRRERYEKGECMKGRKNERKIGRSRERIRLLKKTKIERV